MWCFWRSLRRSISEKRDIALWVGRGRRNASRVASFSVAGRRSGHVKDDKGQYAFRLGTKNPGVAVTIISVEQTNCRALAIAHSQHLRPRHRDWGIIMIQKNRCSVTLRYSALKSRRLCGIPRPNREVR